MQADKFTIRVLVLSVNNSFDAVHLEDRFVYRNICKSQLNIIFGLAMYLQELCVCHIA